MLFYSSERSSRGRYRALECFWKGSRTTPRTLQPIRGFSLRDASIPRGYFPDSRRPHHQSALGPSTSTARALSSRKDRHSDALVTMIRLTTKLPTFDALQDASWSADHMAPSRNSWVGLYWLKQLFYISFPAHLESSRCRPFFTATN